MEHSDDVYAGGSSAKHQHALAGQVKSGQKDRYEFEDDDQADMEMAATDES